MQVVILRELMSSFASMWVPIAATEGTQAMKIGEVFREVGFGEGAEELYVEAFEISPIPGGSKVLFRRAHHSTPPQSYRMGAVLQRIEEAVVNPAHASSTSAAIKTRAPRKQPVAVGSGIPDLLDDF